MNFVYTVHLDMDGNNRFFLIFDDEGDVEHESEPVYGNDEKVEFAAITWIRENS